MIVIRDGDVLTRDGWKTANVVIEDRVISAVGAEAPDGLHIDASGCLVGPGLVDMHAHLRDPGQTWKEDISSASAAAAAGGYTAITAMPNTEPPIDSPGVVEYLLTSARGEHLVDVVPSAALTRGRAGTVATDHGELYRLGVRLFTDDGDCVADPRVLIAVMESIAALPGAFVAQHAEDTTRTRGGHMHEGELSRRLGIGGLPAEAEADMVERDLNLVARTGCRYHCQHVSTKMTIDLIRAARNSGLPVTAEVTPHHLFFDESSVASLDPDFKMYPPLRSAEDRDALVAGLEDGAIDVVATDHAPHLAEEKGVGFAEAPRGVIGLETAAAATWEKLGDRDRFFDVLATDPASLLGLTDQGHPVEAGAVANLMVFDPSATWEVRGFRSRSSNSPFLGRTMQGRVRATIRRGEIVYRDEVMVT